MHPRHDSRAEALEVRALYTIAALARVANVTRYRLRRLLRANGVRLVRTGRALFVPLSEIEKRIPPLWESLCSAEKMRRIAAAAALKGEKLGRPGAPRAQTP
jgi:hypothetical protein